MAGPAPSSLFLRLANLWRHLSLRSDVDDIILELLGRFSLEKIYAGAGDKEAYQNLVTGLLVKLNAIFYLQRLTLPSETLQVGRYLGLIVSWEVALRSVELVLQVVAEGRESLWEDRRLRDKYLAEFLLSALRILTLHPRNVTNQRPKERRERFARIHKSLEQVFDSYPGPKSFLLLVCKEVTNHLHTDPTALGLPQRLRCELPNLTSELYPLEACLLPPHVSELVPHDDFGVGWLAKFLALRDVSHFVVGASVQYAVNQETRNVRLQSSSARSRNAILHALDNLRMPAHLSKVDLVATFSATFRIILPDTLDLGQEDLPDLATDENELEALDALSARLGERKIVLRASDGEMMHHVSQVVRNILVQDNPSGQFGATRPGLFVMNCPECHVAGASQLKAAGIDLPSDTDEGVNSELDPETMCITCGEVITMIREIPLARRTFEILRPLEPDADTINVERHLPTQFQLGPPKLDGGGLFNPGYNSVFSSSEQRPQDTDFSRPRAQGRYASIDSASADPSSHLSQPLWSSPKASSPRNITETSKSDPLNSDSGPYTSSRDKESTQEITYNPQDLLVSPSSPPFSNDYSGFRRPSEARTEQSTMVSPPSETAYFTPRVVPLLTPPEKGKSKWRLPFSSSTRKPSTGASGDSSSLSSTAVEAQKLEEISLGALMSSQKASSRGKKAKYISAYLSQTSTLALFWTQLLIQIWDVGSSPPAIVRSISTESTCILATVAKFHLAYIIGTRDQKLTLRIVNLAQPSAPVVEYRIPSTLWCKCIAIDRKENYVVVGFENSIVRFFKTTHTEQPREDRLHAMYHQDCKGCPPVETLEFSNDGLNLLASTRSAKSGVIQIYSWRFPFLTCQELASCRYPVPLHESEDSGISSAILRSGAEQEESLICITTWTQSGNPVLVQPRDGHKSAIKRDVSGRHSKLGSRIQCAAFSPSGRELVLVNDRGHVYQVSNLNSSPMDIRTIATSKELTTRSDSFSMAYMTLSDEDCVVLAWADPSRGIGWVKKVPVAVQGNMMSDTAGAYGTYGYHDLNGEVSIEVREMPQPPVELAVPEDPIVRKPLSSSPRKSPGIYEYKS